MARVVAVEVVRQGRRRKMRGAGHSSPHRSPAARRQELARNAELRTPADDLAEAAYDAFNDDLLRLIISPRPGTLDRRASRTHAAATLRLTRGSQAAASSATSGMAGVGTLTPRKVFGPRWRPRAEPRRCRGRRSQLSLARQVVGQGSDRDANIDRFSLVTLVMSGVKLFMLPAGWPGSSTERGRASTTASSSVQHPHGSVRSNGGRRWRHSWPGELADLAGLERASLATLCHRGAVAGAEAVLARRALPSEVQRVSS